MHRLIADCPPLDANSLYCNLLQCSHFSGTCALAEADGEVVGFVSGYVEPEAPRTLFIWQVAVAERARGMGLGRHLIFDILRRDHCADVEVIETTITDDNQSSWKMFLSLARALSAPHSRRVLFDRHTHFAGRHESEHLLTIGPFDRNQL